MCMKNNVHYSIFYFLALSFKLEQNQTLIRRKLIRYMYMIKWIYDMPKISMYAQYVLC